MAQQLGLDLPGHPALGREDFMVAPSNAIAVSMVMDWRNWPQNKMVLSGPDGSGKTHLAHVWAADSGARIVEASALATADLEQLSSAPLVVEDVPGIARDEAAQTALFHLHNLMHSTGQPLLLTGRGTPNHWRMSLPDLQSRVDAAGHAVLDLPDDALLSAVLAKLFADRQLTPSPDVIPYLLPRMERSFAAARRLVAAIDAESYARRRPVSRHLAGLVLDRAPSSGR